MRLLFLFVIVFLSSACTHSDTYRPRYVISQSIETAERVEAAIEPESE